MTNGINFYKMDILQKEIYLVPFPFSDFSSKKVRPVLILSNNPYNNHSQDVIICAITRNKSSKFGIRISSSDLFEGKILEDSLIKVENICFIDKTLLIKKLGTLSNETFLLTKEKLSELLE